jgi:hypothetical protein
MSFLRSNWYRLLALIAGPAAVMLSQGAAIADDFWPN